MNAQEVALKIENVKTIKELKDLWKDLPYRLDQFSITQLKLLRNDKLTELKKRRKK